MLLTGATGLLGRYLLRDLTRRGVPLAVLVRPSKRASAAARVEAIMAECESQVGRALPRPRVLAGDISSPNCGLDSDALEWLRSHCQGVIHSAASVMFFTKDNEPWHTNVNGTQHVLDVCRDAGIDQFHHVSSAYTAGLRTGVVRENELDVGQRFGNDYERSKVAAEKLVQQCDHLSAYTIYRPSIIVGDSETGFSTTFHGFYTPLRLASAAALTASVDEIFAVDFLTLMGLRGDEGKNLVPVDWVSDVITTVIDEHPPTQQTFAVVSDSYVSARRLIELYRRVLKEYFPDPRRGSNRLRSAGSAAASPLGPQSVLDMYTEQLAVYRSYWRDDPRFDQSNLQRVLPFKPCPLTDDARLERMCRYALDHQFAWKPRATSAESATAQQFFATLGPHRKHFQAPAADRNGGPHHHLAPVVFTVSGAGGGSWLLASDADQLTVESLGETPAAASQELPRVRMNSVTFAHLLAGQSSWQQAAADGRIVVRGNQNGTAAALPSLISQAAPRVNASQRTP